MSLRKVAYALLVAACCFAPLAGCTGPDADADAGGNGVSDTSSDSSNTTD